MVMMAEEPVAVLQQVPDDEDVDRQDDQHRVGPGRRQPPAVGPHAQGGNLVADLFHGVDLLLAGSRVFHLANLPADGVALSFERLHFRQQAAPLQRVVDPYALAHSRGWWYLVGYCHLRTAVRSFRIDRIRQLDALETGFERPADFDARQYLIAEPQGVPLRVRLRFAPAAAHLALNNRLQWETVEPQPDGSVRVTLSLPDMIWAASLALSYGPVVTVEEPEELRRQVREWAQAVVELYAGQSSRPQH